MRALPNIEIYMPADQYQTEAIFKYLSTSKEPAYVRIGKQVLPDIYSSVEASFTPGRGNVLQEGKDIALIGSGETTPIVVAAGELLRTAGYTPTVVDLPSIKPLDTDLLTKIAKTHRHVITVEEHSIYNGLGAAVAEVLAPLGMAKQTIVGFPDEPAIAGSQVEVFKYYGIDAADIAETAKQLLK